MTAKKGTTKSSVKRKTIGADKKRQREAAPKTVGKSVDPDFESDGSGLGDVIDSLTNDRNVILCYANTDSLQLRARREEYINDRRTIVQGITLEWRGLPAIPVNEEEAGILQDMIDGRHSDGEVGPAAFKKIARSLNLNLVRPGEANPPTPRWDSVADSRVVRSANDVGVFTSIEAVLDAVRYEQANLARQAVLEDLARVAQHMTAVVDAGAPAAFGGEQPKSQNLGQVAL